MLNNQLPTSYQEFIHLSRYSRWLPEEGRREVWGETVGRYFDFFTDHLKEMCEYDLPNKIRNELEDAIISQRVMPSMRCLMTMSFLMSSLEYNLNIPIVRLGITKPNRSYFLRV